MSEALKELPKKQQVFLLKYVQHWNGSRAAREAGYPARSSAQVAYDLLRKPQIRIAVDEVLREKLMEPSEVLARLADQARGSIEPFMRVNERGYIEFDILNPEARNHMHLVKKIRTKGKRVLLEKPTTAKRKAKTTVITEHQWVEVELHDSQKALHMIGQNLKLWTHTFEVNSTLDVEGLESVLDKVYGKAGNKS